MSQSSETAENITPASRAWVLPWTVIVALLGVTGAILYSRGMIPWCKWDSPLWLISLDAWSKHNSQHLLDPYSLSHFQHGLIFFWFFNAILGKRLNLHWLLVLSVGLEAGWELLENSPTVIEQYRANTASLEYYGDSILNTMGDILACIVGFFAAFKMKWTHGLILFVAIEVFMLLTIRDSLLINVLMLTYPVEAVKIWQTGG